MSNGEERTPTMNDTTTTSRCALAAGSGGWTPVGEEMPKRGQKVLVCGHWSNGNRWRTIAEWWPAGTMDASDWDDPPEDWWDVDGNTCINLEAGWYESRVEAETMWALSNVTHWMPLPDFPNIGDDPRP